MRKPLMPKATASWLIENTSLSFKQISNFVGLHILEVQAIADGEVSSGVLSRNPLENGELTNEEIEKCEKNEKLDDFGVFGPGNGFLTKFGARQKINRPKVCLGGDFLGQNRKFENVPKFSKMGALRGSIL